MDIIIVGEDLVTREILKRILLYTNDGYNIIREEPTRGGEIVNKAKLYNILGLPVALLTDLDSSPCPPHLITNWFGQHGINDNLLFRIACDEAESWLMSDRVGFSKFLGVDVDLIPKPTSKDKFNPANIELVFKYKPSLYMMRELTDKSNKSELVEKLKPREGAKKGPEYNSALLPFIREKWNIKEAAKNSYSLQKAILRTEQFYQ